MSRKILPYVLLVAMVLVGISGYAQMRAAAAPGQSMAAMPVSAPADLADGSSAESGSPRIFTLQPGQSVARFTIDEILAGQANTVVGTTGQVSGQIAVDPSAPSDAQVGAILVDARTLTTDDSKRNRMIESFILSTNDYPYVSFVPTSITGLPDSASIGTPYSLQINGQLTIKDVTRDVTFDATVTPVSPTELNGTATTMIPYADWGISIPQVPLVAGVGDQVKLTLDFVGTAS